MKLGSRKAQANVILFACSLLYLTVFFNRTSPSVLIDPMSTDFNLEPKDFSLWSSLYFWSYAASQLLLTPFVDKFGAYYIVSITQVLSVVGSIIIGATSSFFVASVGRFLIGVGVSATFVPSNYYFSKWFSIDRFSSVLAMFMMVGGFGSVVSAAPLAMFLDKFGWRAASFFVAIITAICLGIFMLFAGEPEDLFPEEQEGGKDAPKKKSINVADIYKGMLEAMKMREIKLLILWTLTITSVFFVVGLFLIGYLRDIGGMSKTSAEMVVTLYNSGLLWGAMIVSYLHKRWGTKKYMLIVVFNCLVTLIIMCFVTKGMNVWIWPLIVVQSFSVSPSANALFSAAKVLGYDKVGSVVSLCNFPVFLGAAIFQVVAGQILSKVGTSTTDPNDDSRKIYDFAGYRAVWIFLTISTLITFIGFFFYRPEVEEGKRKEAEEKANGTAVEMEIVVEEIDSQVEEEVVEEVVEEVLEEEELASEDMVEEEVRIEEGMTERELLDVETVSNEELSATEIPAEE
ncbi:hypothetical protein PCE1_001377 [Barthelona sp. PCE]